MSVRSLGRRLIEGGSYSNITKLKLCREFSNSTRSRIELNRNDILSIRSCDELQNRLCPHFIGIPHSKLRKIVWDSPLQNIYLVKKPWNQAVRNATVEFIRHIQLNYPAVNIITSEDVADELFHETSHAGLIKSMLLKQDLGPNKITKYEIYTGPVKDIVAKTDLIVTLGGDGTILRAVSTFLNANVPPILSFALGTLGFLLPFDFNTYPETFRTVYTSQSKAMHRSRLECHVRRRSSIVRAEQDNSTNILNKQIEDDVTNHRNNPFITMLNAMNDIALHRGGQPNLTSVDIFIDNDKLTTSNADGVIFATPTGSTAYSLSAGGSIVHPLVPCIILTPICPRSLSFRPLILPVTSHIMVRLSEKNRNSNIRLTIDGIPQRDLEPGDQIHIVSEHGTIYIPGKYDSPSILSDRKDFNNVIDPGYKFTSKVPDTADTVWPSTFRREFRGIWCIARSENDWTKDINELLGFNSSFRALKGLT